MSITHPPQAVPGPRINITYNAFTLDEDDSDASWNQARTLSISRPYDRPCFIETIFGSTTAVPDIMMLESINIIMRLFQ